MKEPQTVNNVPLSAECKPLRRPKRPLTNAELKKHEQIGALKQAEWTLRELQTGGMRAPLTLEDEQEIKKLALEREMKAT